MYEQLQGNIRSVINIANGLESNKIFFGEYRQDYQANEVDNFLTRSLEMHYKLLNNPEL